MARKFTVMGFTEAELGFVLAAFFAAVGVAYQQERNIAIDDGGHSIHVADSLRRVNGQLGDSLSATRDSLVLLKDSLNITRQKPHCSEKGEPNEAIARLVIVGPNAYVIGGDTLGFADVERRLQPQIIRGQFLRCIYSVEAVAVLGVDATVHTIARSRLRSHFNVRDRR